MFRSRKTRSERINRINNDNRITLLNNQDFVGIPDRSPIQEDEEKASELPRTSGFGRGDLVSVEMDDEFFNGPSPPVSQPISKVKTAVGLISLAGIAVGVGYGIKKKLTKKKKKKKAPTRQEILTDVLNDKTMDELKSFIPEPLNKSREEIIKEIINKII